MAFCAMCLVYTQILVFSSMGLYSAFRSAQLKDRFLMSIMISILFAEQVVSMDMEKTFQIIFIVLIALCLIFHPLWAIKFNFWITYNIKSAMKNVQNIISIFQQVKFHFALIYVLTLKNSWSKILPILNIIVLCVLRLTNISQMILLRRVVWIAAKIITALLLFRYQVIFRLKSVITF